MITKLTANADTPLYLAQFINEHQVVVGGGGGVGKHGVVNKLAMLDVQASELAPIGEFKFPEGADCPTSAAWDGVLVVGCNVPAERGIDRLHVFTTQSGLVEAGAMRTFVNDDVTVFQKSVSASGGRVAVAASDESKVYVASLPAVAQPPRIDSGEESKSEEDADKADAQPAESNPEPNAFLESLPATIDAPSAVLAVVLTPRALCVLTADKLLIRTASGTHEVESGREKWARMAYDSDEDQLAVVGNEALSVVPLNSCKVEARGKIGALKAATALAAARGYVAAANAQGDIYVYEERTAGIVCKFLKTHTLPVTALAFSPNGSVLVSTSMDGSVVAHAKLQFKPEPSSKMIILSLVVFVFAIIALYVQKRHHLAERLDEFRTGSQNARARQAVPDAYEAAHYEGPAQNVHFEGPVREL